MRSTRWVAWPLGSAPRAQSGWPASNLAAPPLASRYAASSNPLLFRIKVDSPMDMGADIDWLSIYPSEQEVLYPPLSYLQPIFQQSIKFTTGSVITMKISFPS